MQLSQNEWAAPIAIAIKQTTWNRFYSAYHKKFKKELDASTFVVLASVALVHPQSKSFVVVSVGEGTKSLPSCLVLEDNSKDLLADMHAEMLALRGFRRFLLQQLKKEDSQYLQWNQKKKKQWLKKDWEVWLYCSEVFCGDCCINQQQQSFSGAKPLAFLKEEKYLNQKFAQNVLRTKPGRTDLPVNKRSAILSCSDLIGVCNVLGVQGKALFSSIVPIYLSRIIVDSCERLRERLCKGIDLQARLSIILGRSCSLIHRQIFNIVVEGKQRQISSQFCHKVPDVIILEKKESRDRQGFQLCGVFTLSDEEWINGRTGLPEGSSIKNYKQKGKISKYSQTSLAKDFQFYKENGLSFKYDAILDRLKRLFGEWIEGAGQ